MGDRTTVIVVCRREDVKQVCGIMFRTYADGDKMKPDLAEQTGEIAERLEFCEMNYAAEDQIREMAKRRLVFYGWHFPGYSYPEGMFVSDGEKFFMCVGVTDAEGPVAEVLPDGTISESDLEQATAYWEALARVQTSFRIEKNSPAAACFG